MVRHGIIGLSGDILTVVDYPEDMTGQQAPGFPDGVIAVAHPDVGPDWTWDGAAFHAPPVPPSAPLTLADYWLAIEAFLNARVAERQYFSIYTAISYRFSGNATWAAEATAALAWRDEVLTIAYGVLAQVQAGSIPPPTISALIEMLPALVWPVP